MKNPKNDESRKNYAISSVRTDVGDTALGAHQDRFVNEMAEEALQDLKKYWEKQGLR